MSNCPFPLALSEQPADYKHRGDLESDMGGVKACRFPRTLLGPCSGIEDNDFGFKDGKPCLIVKLNRIVNFRPRVLLLSLLLCFMSYFHISFWVLYIFLSHLLSTLYLLPFSFYLLSFFFSSFLSSSIFPSCIVQVLS